MKWFGFVIFIIGVLSKLPPVVVIGIILYFSGRLLDKLDGGKQYDTP